MPRADQEPLVTEAAPGEAPAGPVHDATANVEAGRPKWSRDQVHAFLSAQPKVKVMIPMDLSDPPGGAYQPIIYQGWLIPVPKGRMVDVPLPLAGIIENMMQAERTQQARDSQAWRMNLANSDSEYGLLIDAR